MARIRIKEHITVRAGDLLPNPDNWRVHPPAQRAALEAVIAEVGHVAEALAVRTRRGLMLIDGHLRASIDPEESIPVAVLDLTAAEQRKVLATLDPIGGMAERDDGKWRALLAQQDANTDAFRKTLVSFEASLDGKASRSKGRTQPDDQPEISTAPTAQPGDLYRLGNHRILCGDTTNEDDVARLMGGELAAMTLTDPPYAIYGSSTGIGSDMSDDKMVRPFFEAILRVIFDTSAMFAHAYVCCDWRSWPSWWEMSKRTRLTPKNLIVWDKGGSGLGSSYANTHEMVGFFAKLPKQTVMKSNEQSGQRQVFASNVIRCNKVPGGSREHNAAKPVELLAELITNSSDEGDLVVDWFSGSGSTLIAAEQTGRRCATMEIEPRYVDVTVRRWEQFTGGKAELERKPAKAKARKS